MSEMYLVLHLKMSKICVTGSWLNNLPMNLAAFVTRRLTERKIVDGDYTDCVEVENLLVNK